VAVWTKHRPDAPLGVFVSEAAGLDWIRVAGGPPVPQVHEVTATTLVIDRVMTAEPSPTVAEDFGRRLATLHAQGAHTYGAAITGFIGPTADLLTMDNAPSDTWATHYRDRRLAPMLRQAVDRGTVDAAGAAAVEAVMAELEQLAPEEGPARLHGDLWHGNCLWSTDAVWLIDPAAHGGHRESDLAMLALFGLPHLERVLAAYDEATPLADGWQERQAVHQLWPLLVHAVLFGGDYGLRVADTARRAGGR
jgi:fructosamine-3-kinase